MPHLVPRLNDPRTVLRQAAAGIALALVAALLAWAPAPPAAAHGELLYADPAESSVLEVLPSRVYLTFSDVITEVREITVVGPDGSVTNGAPTSVGPEVRQTLWAGAEGAYTLEYFVVSADGHDVRGEVHFEVGSAATAATPDASGATAATPDQDGWSERGRAALVPAGLVLVAVVVALVLLRRRRVGASTDR